MSKIINEINIDASPQKVWGVLSNLEEVAKYNSTIKSAQYISENKEGVGAARQCELDPKGSIKERVTKVEEGHAIEMELYKSPYPLVFNTWRTEIKSNGNGGTTVSQVMEYKLKFGAFGAVLDTLVMRGKMAKIMNEMFISMKKYIETGETVYRG